MFFFPFNYHFGCTLLLYLMRLSHISAIRDIACLFRPVISLQQEGGLPAVIVLKRFQIVYILLLL